MSTTMADALANDFNGNGQSWETNCSIPKTTVSVGQAASQPTII
jgi:hypothetical protein